jgi:excisionase family DNA binding protein
MGKPNVPWNYNMMIVKDIAERTGLSPYTIRRLVDQGFLPGRQSHYGGRWRFNEGDWPAILQKLQRMGLVDDGACWDGKRIERPS